MQGPELTSETARRRGSSHNQPHATGTTGPIPGPLVTPTLGRWLVVFAIIWWLVVFFTSLAEFGNVTAAIGGNPQCYHGQCVKAGDIASASLGYMKPTSLA